MSTANSGYHHGDLRAALEDAAIGLLATKPAAAVSLREVARRAGVSHGAPAHHFGDKQGLLKAVSRRGLGDLLAAMEAAAARGEGPRARLVSVGEAYVGVALESPGLFGAIFDPDICDPRDPDPVTKPLIDANDQLLTREVREAFGGRLDDAQVEVLAAALWSVVHGLGVLVAAGHLPPETVRPALEAILAAQLPE